MSVILVSHTGTYEKWVKYFLQQLNYPQILMTDLGLTLSSS